MRMATACLLIFLISPPAGAEEPLPAPKFKRPLTATDDVRLEKLNAAINAAVSQGDLLKEQEVIADLLAFQLEFRDETNSEVGPLKARQKILERVLALDTASQERFSVARQLENKAIQLFTNKKLNEAQHEIEAALATYRELLGPRDYSCGRPLAIYAAIVHGPKGPEAAIDLMLEAVAVQEAEVGRANPYLMTLYVDIARNYIVLEHWEEADKWLGIAREIVAADKSKPEDSIAVQLHSARCCLHLGRYLEAQRAAECAIAWTAGDEAHIQNELKAWLLLGEAHVWQKQFYAASKAYEFGLRLATKVRIVSSESTLAAALDHYAIALRQIGHLDNAIAVEAKAAEYRAALEAREARQLKGR